MKNTIQKMTIIIIRLLFISIATMLINCEKSDSAVTMYAIAKSGLIIRSDATTSSKKNGAIPFGAAVQIKSQKKDQVTISGKKGRWTRIEYDGIDGWVFGGFLSANPPAKPEKETSTQSEAKKCKALWDCYDKLESCNSVDGCNPSDQAKHDACTATYKVPANCGPGGHLN